MSELVGVLQENKIVFNVLGRLHGSFQITATFEAQGPKRVTIKYRNSKLVSISMSFWCFVKLRYRTGAANCAEAAMY